MAIAHAQGMPCTMPACIKHWHAYKAMCCCPSVAETWQHGRNTDAADAALQQLKSLLQKAEQHSLHDKDIAMVQELALALARALHALGRGRDVQTPRSIRPCRLALTPPATNIADAFLPQQGPPRLERLCRRTGALPLLPLKIRKIRSPASTPEGHLLRWASQQQDVYIKDVARLLGVQLSQGQYLSVGKLLARKLRLKPRKRGLTGNGRRSFSKRHVLDVAAAVRKVKRCGTPRRASV